MQRQQRKYSIVPATAALFLSLAASATIHQQPLPRDYPTRVAASVRIDKSTGRCAYSYAITNPPSNPRGVESLTLQFQPHTAAPADIRSPRGWTAIYLADKHRLSWAATEVSVPRHYVDDGNTLAGDYVIAPGATLAGFSFTSSDPPGPGLGITQVYAPLPSADDDDELDGLPFASTVAEDNGFRLRLTMPVPAGNAALEAGHEKRDVPDVPR